MLVSSLARVAASVIRSTNSCVLAWAKGPFEIYEQGRELIMPFCLDAQTAILGKRAFNLIHFRNMQRIRNKTRGLCL